jgi:ParB family transcriptional regulator, chromosome partitioning protein
VGRRSGLGKGLNALIPASERVETPQAHLQELPVAHIEPNPAQPRAHFDDDALTALTASILEVGVLQPVLVRLIGPDRYELIAGERRWRAARQAGLRTIPALVRSADPTQSLEQALVENLHREDLNPLEEAAAYQQLVDEFGLTQEEVARRVGRSRPAVANTMRLLQLPPTVQKYVADRQLSAGHARAVLAVPDRGIQEELARLAVEEELTVREVEDLVRRQLDGDAEASAGGVGAQPPAPSAPRPPGSVRPASILEAEETLGSILDTRVAVQVGARRGKVVIEFATLDDLERITRVIRGDATAVDPAV